MPVDNNGDTSKHKNVRREFEEITKQGPVSFNDLHPTQSARQNPHVPGTDTPNDVGIDGQESRWVHCAQCGWYVDSAKTSRGSGRGNQTFETVSGSSYTSPSNPIDTIGCPFCGASEW